MLSCGVVPCLPPWPVKEIKLQGRYAGYNTDDFIVITEERTGGRKAKLLAQIRHSLSITENDSTFSDVIQAAWLDFQNPQLFDPKNDAIALISGPLARTTLIMPDLSWSGRALQRTHRSSWIRST